MNFNKNNRVNVVKRGQKEEMITDFICGHIAKLTNTVSSGKSDQISVFCLARSPSSPVAKALVALHKNLDEAGIGVRVIFSHISKDVDAVQWTDFGANVAFARDIRMVTRAELNDAHELLVLDSMTSWVGDCLRREPTKTDAYEYYAPDCPSSASNAITSFERLWQICKPVAIRQISNADEQMTEKSENDSNDAIDPSMLDEFSDDSGPMSATRH